MKKTSTVASATSKSVEPLYSVKRLTKNTKSYLWVAFPANKPSAGLVFSGKLTRDAVRNATAKKIGSHINDIRARRVKSFRSM